MRVTSKQTFYLVLFIAVITFAAFFIPNLVSRMDNRSYTIITVMKNAKSHTEFWEVVQAGIMTAAKEYDANIVFTGADSESDVDGQIAALEKALKSKPDAILLAASDYNLIVPTVNKFKSSGIKLVAIDSGLNSTHLDSFIATDNIEAGKKAGQAVEDELESNAKIAIISYVKGSQTAIEREMGVMLGIGEDTPKTRVQTYYCDDDSEKAYKLTTDLLLNDPAVKGIVGLNETSAIGAARAIFDLGLGGKVKLIGFDSSSSEVKFLESGVIQAIVVQKPFNIGYLGIKTAVQILKGKKVEKRIDTGSELVTKETMYTEENQKILFPFIN